MFVALNENRNQSIDLNTVFSPPKIGVLCTVNLLKLAHARKVMTVWLGCLSTFESSARAQQQHTTEAH